jgi:hypothetical protein
MTSIALPQEESATAAPTTDNEPLTTDSEDVFARNHRNAQHSTGPRTQAGKTKSAQNARKHNLSSTTPPRDLLTDPTYQLSKQEFIEEFQPATPTQHILVNQLTYVAWKLTQIPKLERQLLATPLGETTPADPDSGVDTSADHESPEDYVVRRLNDPDAPPAPKDPTNDLTAEHLLQDKPTPLTRLWDHHRRLLSRFQSVVRQIRQLQRQEHEPFLKEKRDRQRRQKEDDAFIDQYLDQVHQRNKEQEQQQPPPADPSHQPHKSHPAAQTRQNVPQRTIPTPPAQNEPTPEQSAIANPQSAIVTSSPPISTIPPPAPTVPPVAEGPSPSGSAPETCPATPRKASGH